MKTKVFTSISIMGALGILAAMPAYALGLGKLQLSSALNEPFQAEIPITSASEEESDSLQVRLASNAEFERAGLVKSAEINALQFNVITRNGKPVILVSSKAPVKEPLLDFLLFARTSTGQLIREYTVLLDPPKTIFKDTQAQRTYITPAAPVETQAQPTQTVKKVASAPSMAGATQYGPVSKTDTLWNIALKTRPSRDVSVHQMMVALVDKNSNAFINDNINGLKSGYTLAIPSQSEINRLSHSQALAEVQTHNNAWKNRHNTAPVTTPAPVAASPTDTASDTLAVEETLPSTAAVQNNDETPVARLQLLGENEESLQDNDMAAFGNEKVDELSEQLTMAQEVIESQQQENVDIKARMAAMEEQIETLRKLVALQDPDLARLQSKLEQEDDATLEAMAQDIKDSLANTLNDEPVPADAFDEEMPAEQADELENASDADASEGDEIEQNTPVLDNVDSLSPEQAPEVIAPVTAPEPSLLDQVISVFERYKLQALLGILGVLLALFFVARKRAEDGKKVSWDEAVGDITPAAAAPVAATAVVAQPTPEVEKSVEELMDDAQALIQHGDTEQAIDILEQARTIEPNNQTVLQQLLSAHYQQGNVNEFTKLAQDYDVERDSMEWDEVSNWGRELAPDNALFVSPVTDVEEVLDLDGLTDLSLDANTDELEEIDITPVDEALDDEGMVEFTLPEIEDITEEPLDTIEEEALIEKVDDATPEWNTKDDEADLSLNIDELDDITDDELEQAGLALSTDNDDTLSFDLSDFDQIDEAETKIDLATAYIEMGDPEGAKAILEEILVEGNEEQQSRAKTILNDLS